MAENATYGGCEPFDIDHGELSGLTPQMCFTLGVEWQMFRDAMERTPEPFERQIHTANSARLQAMCMRAGRHVKEEWLHDDYDGWRVLVVGKQPEVFIG